MLGPVELLKSQAVVTLELRPRAKRSMPFICPLPRAKLRPETHRARKAETTNPRSTLNEHTNETRPERQCDLRDQGMCGQWLSTAAHRTRGTYLRAHLAALRGGRRPESGCHRAGCRCAYVPPPPALRAALRQGPYIDADKEQRTQNTDASDKQTKKETKPRPSRDTCPRDLPCCTVVRVWSGVGE